jgi:hypothetical protein
MRTKLEINKLQELAIESMKIDMGTDEARVIEWQNKIGEIFVFQAGELIGYTDTRVIHHEDDGLVNLAAEPLMFDELPEMDMSTNV